MKRNMGFTLVELLVVIAIITILASIIVPNVANWIGRARLAKAVSEINSADLALTKMLSDAEKSTFGHFFTNVSFSSWQQAEAFYTEAFYILLRKGRDLEPYEISRLGLLEEVRKKLGTSYMDLGKDPWGELYHFFSGPMPRAQRALFRIYEADTSVPGGPALETVNPASFPHPDEDRVLGWAAPDKLPVYIYSKGADLASAQAMYLGNGINAYGGDLPDIVNMGGGDDINNWDNGQSWAEFY